MPNRIPIGARPAVCLAVLALLAAAGCGPDEQTATTTARLKGLATLYLDYAVGKNGKGPGREQELKKHMDGLPDFVLRANGVDPNALGALFVSERDGEPFVVLYGTGITEISGTSAPVIAHEKTGRNGQRLAAFANGKVVEVDEARLQELIAGKP